MRVIVTRPRAQAAIFVEALRGAGIDAVALPLIEIRPVPDPRPLAQAWRELPDFALVMFVSTNAVQQFMHQRPPGMRWPSTVLAASTGPGTSAALRAAGVPDAALVQPAGEVFDSEALWQQLQPRDWAGRRALIVRGERGRDWLAEHLRQAGATVDLIAAYQRHLPQFGACEQAQLDQALAQPTQCLWLFSSSEAVANLGLLAPGSDWSAAGAIGSHPRIVSQTQRLGFGRVELGELSVAGVTARLATWLAAPGTRSIQSDAS